jgi:predicted RecA/RadA family phage recombinase
MRSYLGPGDKVELTAPAGGVLVDVGYVIGTGTFVVAEGPAAVGAKFIGLRYGTFRLLKNTAEAIVEGAKVYWDDTTKRVRNAAATGRFQIGVAEKAQLAADLTCDVKLDGIGVTVLP